MLHEDGIRPWMGDAERRIAGIWDHNLDTLLDTLRREGAISKPGTNFKEKTREQEIKMIDKSTQLDYCRTNDLVASIVLNLGGNMKKLLVIAILSLSSASVFADQQCSYYAGQMVCRDHPSYRDAQVNSSIPLQGNYQSLGSILQNAQNMRNQQLQNQLIFCKVCKLLM